MTEPWPSWVVRRILEDQAQMGGPHGWWPNGRKYQTSIEDRRLHVNLHSTRDVSLSTMADQVGLRADTKLEGSSTPTVRIGEDACGGAENVGGDMSHARNVGESVKGTYERAYPERPGNREIEFVLTLALLRVPTPMPAPEEPSHAPARELAGIRYEGLQTLPKPHMVAGRAGQ